MFCFKRNKSIKEFFDIVYRFTACNKFGIPFENLPDYVQRLESEADTLIEQIEEKKLEKQEALEDYDVTLESLEEYMENRPLFETNEKLREQLDKVRQQRDNYATELMSERIGKVLDEYNNCWVTDN